MTDNPHSNTFLKNLSQKKYAWMEEAIASNPPPAAAAAAAASIPHEKSTHPDARNHKTTSIHNNASPGSNSNKKNKSKRSSPEPEMSNSPSKKTSKTKPKAVFSPTMSNSPTTTTTTNTASSTATPQLPIDGDVINIGKPKYEPRSKVHEPRLPQPHFKYTTFPVKGYNILPTRNITSNYARNDTSYFPGHRAGAEEIAPDPEEEWRDTIVIHPGSRNLRLGLASEAFPISVPHVIARRFSNIPSTEMANDKMKLDDALDYDTQEKHDIALREIRGELKWRMKNAKRRAVPNAEGQVIGFNTNGVKETILDHNDPYKVEWTDLSKGTEYYVGEKAINAPISKDAQYRILYPWKDGTINNQDYTSLHAALADLEVIWTESIVNELEIEKSDFKSYNAVLVLPDQFDHGYLCDLVTMMLRYMEFRGIIITQESTCATYGAGISSAVVVDIGAQKTTIACIEDGVCQTDSRISIGLGGDDITRTFASFLLANKFPYQEIDLNTTFDWRLAELLKEKWCTMNEADISVQVYDFFARTPFKPTLKYQCKVYDEAFLAPLCLVYPDILTPKKKKYTWLNKNVTDDPIEDSNNKKRNLEFDSYPIDVAIAKSIVSASNGSEEKLKRYFQSIILVGGGGKVANFSKVLEDRVLSTVIAQKAEIDRVEVLPAPRELDPEVLVWKGASVVGKLDSAKDMWIGLEEWESIGARCLRERALLM